MTRLPLNPEIYELEKKVLSYSGLKLNEELFVYDVTIEINDKEHLIHTYRCGDQNSEVLVLLHGYCGGSALFFKMLKELSTRFKVYCMDHVGMGLSSREGFHCTSTEETIDFFVEAVEKWREANNIERFFLAGHSFGGYVGTHYTLKHEFRVQKLVLLSPAGITKYPVEPTIEQAAQKYGFVGRKIYTLAMNYWQNRRSPMAWAKDHPWMAKVGMKAYVYHKFILPYSEANAIENYLYGMMQLPQGTEDGIFYILKPPGAIAIMPLEELLPKINIVVDCYFGEVDHLDQSGAKRVTEKKNDFKMKVVPKAGHQLPVQNPEGLAKELVVSIKAWEGGDSVGFQGVDPQEILRMTTM